LVSIHINIYQVHIGKLRVLDTILLIIFYHPDGYPLLRPI